MKRDFQIKFLKEMGLKPKDYFLDVGCGTLRGGIPIIHYLEKKHYCGIEVRPNVLEEGRKELLESKLTHKEPVLILSNDLSSLNLEREFDYIWAFSVLIHFTDKILENCFTFVNRHLSKQGVFFANVNLDNKIPDSRGREFPVVSRSLNFYKDKAILHGLNVQDIGLIKEFGHLSGRPGDLFSVLKISKN